MEQNTPIEPQSQGFGIDFKPNMYPIMYWALAYGAAAGVALFLVNVLSTFIGALWAPVFLVGLIWGGYRNYQKQKAAWRMGQGVSSVPQTPIQEFKTAVSDVVSASKEMMAEQQTNNTPQTGGEVTQEGLEEQENPPTGSTPIV